MMSIMPAVTYTVNVVSGQAASTRVMYNGSAISNTNKLAVVANTPTSVQIVNVDSQGNAVPVLSDATNGGLVVALNDSTGSFRQTVNGASLSYVTIPVGQSSVSVYYVNGTAGSYDLTGDGVPVGQSLAVTAPGSMIAGTANTSFRLAFGTAPNTAYTAYGATLPVSVTGQLPSPSSTAATVPTSVAFTSGANSGVSVTLTDAVAQKLTFNIDGLSATMASPVTPSPAQTITAGSASATVPGFTTLASAWQYSSNAIATAGTLVGATDMSANIHINKTTSATVSSIVFTGGATKTLVITMSAAGTNLDTVTINANQFQDTYGNVLSGIITLTSNGTTWTPTLN